MSYKPLVYVDDAGNTYPDHQESVKTYPLYSASVVEELLKANRILLDTQQKQITVIGPNQKLWDLLDDVRNRGMRCLKDWQMSIDEKSWGPVPLINNRCLVVNSVFSYRKMKHE